MKDLPLCTFAIVKITGQCNTTKTGNRGSILNFRGNITLTFEIVGTVYKNAL